MSMNNKKNGAFIAKKRGGLGKLFVIAYRNIYRNKRRTTFCIVAISVTVFFIISMAALMDGFIDNFAKQVLTYETGDVLITSKDFENKNLFLPLQYPIEVPGKDLSALVREIGEIPSVGLISPRIKTHVSLLNSVIKNALLWGIDIERELGYNVFNYKTKNANKCLVTGRYPSGKANECAIGFRLASRMGVTIGDKIQLKIVSSEFSNKFYFPTIVGITDFNMNEMDKEVVIIPFEKAQKLAGLAGTTQIICVYAMNRSEAPSVIAALEKKFGTIPGISIKPFEKNPLIAYMKSTDIMMAIIYIIFMIVASFLIINTIIMIIHERIKEIGMMAALGMTRKEIVLVFFLESVVLSGIGSLIGCLAGGIATFVVSKFPFDIGAVMEDMMAMNNTIFVTFSPSIIAQGFAYGLIISGLCTLIPSLKSAFVKPVEAIRR
jgi:putative ABC transport system permease protein